MKTLVRKTKRLLVATFIGLIFGYICYGLALNSAGPMPWPAAVEIVMGRALIGFVIGLSAFHMIHWTIHGIVIGLIISLPLAFDTLLAPAHPHLSRAALFAWTIVMGGVYGFAIEFITSIALRLREE